MRNENGKKICLIYKYGVIFLCVLIGLLLFFSIMSAKENLKWLLYNLFVSALIVSCGYRVVMRCLNNIVLDKCDLLTYKVFLKELVKKDYFQNNTKIHFTLLHLNVGLGDYKEVLEEVHKLEHIKNKLSRFHNIEINLLHIDYLIATDNTPIKEIKMLLKELEYTKMVRRGKFLKLKNSICLREYLILREWEEAIMLLKSDNPKNVYEQVVNSYLLGICYFNVQKYEIAFQKLTFVVRHGGNSKYPFMAQEILVQIPQNQTYKKLFGKTKNNKYKVVCESLLAILLIGLIISTNINNQYSINIESAYRVKYRISKNKKVDILYQQNVGAYKMAIIFADNQVVYCLLEYEKDKENIKYRIYDSFRTNMQYVNISKNSKPEGTSSMKKFIENSSVEDYLGKLATEFYKPNIIFTQNDFSFVGVYCEPIVSEVEIQGQKVNIIDENKVENTIFYIWKAENIDYETINYKDVKVK